MIHIKKIVLLNVEDLDLARIVAEVEIDQCQTEIWFEVNARFEGYLCHERSDAFVVGLLNYAMRNGHDIVCDSPIGEDIFYQLDTYFIDAVTRADKRLYRVQIFADVESSQLPNKGAVGTGISGGIDSLHAIAANTDNRFLNHRVTHLAFNNVGSHGEGKRAENLYRERKKRAEDFCEEYGFEYVESNSNIMDVIEQDHYLTHTYTSCFAVLALQKLYKYYYYASSGDDLARFSLKNNSTKGTSYYDFLSLQSFSTDSLKMYSEGAALSRLEKTKVVSDYMPAYKYLNVCLVKSDNCSRCEKCSRTLLALDILEKLDLFHNMFDIEYYKSHRRKYYVNMYYMYKSDKYDYIELYNGLRDKVTLSIRCWYYLKVIKKFIASNFPEGKLKSFIKKSVQNI